jgi:DNA polymerase III alpha subunit
LNFLAAAKSAVKLGECKKLGKRTEERMLSEREIVPFSSLADFFHRVVPSAEEFESIIRSGACDEFGDTRTRQSEDAAPTVQS